MPVPISWWRAGVVLEARLEALRARDDTPERWARAHAREFLQGLAAREILDARQPDQPQQSGRARQHDHTAASATAPGRAEHPDTDADPYAEARAAAALARPPATRANSAPLPLDVPARYARTSGAARSSRPHR